MPLALGLLKAERCQLPERFSSQIFALRFTVAYQKFPSEKFLQMQSELMVFKGLALMQLPLKTSATSSFHTVLGCRGFESETNG